MKTRTHLRLLFEVWYGNGYSNIGQPPPQKHLSFDNNKENVSFAFIKPQIHAKVAAHISKYFN